MCASKLNNNVMIKGLIFDYGGTIDTDGTHWSEVIWSAYKIVRINVPKKDFRDAYVFAERELARRPLIKPSFSFLDMLKVKMDIETKFLTDAHIWNVDENERKLKSDVVAEWLDNFVLNNLEKSRDVLSKLSEKYPMVLVSNFYGNIKTVLDNYKINFFQNIVESAVVGVRKPDPAIFRLGVEALGFQPEETIVVGDSYKKDISPAKSLGCNTVWIKGLGWKEDNVDDTDADRIIFSISQILSVLPTFSV